MRRNFLALIVGFIIWQIWLLTFMRLADFYESSYYNYALSNVLKIIGSLIVGIIVGCISTKRQEILAITSQMIAIILMQLFGYFDNWFNELYIDNSISSKIQFTIFSFLSMSHLLITAGFGGFLGKKILKAFSVKNGF